jgi:hypothetical protein
MNDDWINEFEKTDKLYQDFYKDNLYYTNIYYLYINKENEIEKIKHENFLMSSPNCITREEIIGILKRNSSSVCENQPYSLLSIAKYNVSLDTEEIVDFLRCDEEDMKDYNDRFLTSIKHIDAIYFEKSIHMLHDLNDLFILFYEKMPERSLTNHSITKRVYLQKKTVSHHKKTIRNYEGRR